jgi:hypothetical protein
MEFCHCQWISKAQCFLAVLFDGYTVLKKGLSRGLRISKVCPKSSFHSQIMNLDVYLSLFGAEMLFILHDQLTVEFGRFV